MRDIKMHRRRTCDSSLNLTENDLVFVLIVYRNTETVFDCVCETCMK